MRDYSLNFRVYTHSRLWVGKRQLAAAVQGGQSQGRGLWEVEGLFPEFGG